MDKRKTIGHCTVCQKAIKQGDRIHEGRIVTDNTGPVKRYEIPMYCDQHAPEGVN